MSREYPFEISVVLVNRPNLRDDEMYMCMGQQFLIDVFESEKEMEQESIFLFYPERWLNILEQRIIFDILKDRCPKLKELEIVTHSPFIVQCCKKEWMKVTSHEKYPDQSYTKGVRYCPPLKPDAGLQVFGAGQSLQIKL